MALCVWFLSLTMFSSFIQIIACIRASFLVWLNNIPLYRWAMFCLFICQLMDIWAGPTSWLSWIVLQWICVYVNLFVSVFSCFWSDEFCRFSVHFAWVFIPLHILLHFVLANDPAPCTLETGYATEFWMQVPLALTPERTLGWM